MTRPDDRLKAWRRSLDPSLAIAYPVSHPVTTLMGIADRLQAVRNVLDTLDAEQPEDRQFGLALANMAADYAVRLLGHLGLIDGGAGPPLTTLKMADLVLGNLVVATEGHIHDHRQVARQEEEAAGDPLPTQPETPTAVNSSGGLEIDSDTFTVRYKGKSCFLGDAMMAFRLLVRLAKSPGVRISHHELAADVWGDEHTETATIHKQASILKKRLGAAGMEGVVIDAKVHGHYALMLS